MNEYVVQIKKLHGDVEEYQMRINAQHGLGC